MEGLKPKPPQVLLWLRGGWAFLKFDGGWLELGPEAEVMALDPAEKLALIHRRLRGANWHDVSGRLM